MSRFLILLILCSYILSLGLGLVGPERKRLKLLRKKVKSEKGVVLRRRGRLDSLKKKKEEIAKHGEGGAKMKRGLPENSEPSYLLELVQEAVSREALMLAQIESISTSIRKKKERGNLKEASVSLEVKGSYRSFLALLSRLEKSARLIEVDWVSFSVPEEAEESSLLDFEVSLRTHSFTSEGE